MVGGTYSNLVGICLCKRYVSGMGICPQCYAPINLKPAGGGRAWGGDLIVIVGPGVGLLTGLAFLGEGIFESVFAQCGDIEHRLE